jgi:hypothetical protein
MRLELTSRARECAERIRDLEKEYKDYELLVSCIRALAAVKINPTKFEYSDDDYNKVVDKVRDLCARHEIRLPDDTDWDSVDIV